MHRVIKYSLVEGMVPDFVFQGDGTWSGQFHNPTDESFVGIGSVTGAELGITVFATKEELTSYLQTYLGEVYTQGGLSIDIIAKANDFWNLII